MKRGLYYGILIVLIGIFAFSAYQVGHYMMEKNKSVKVTEDVMQYTTAVDEGTREKGEPERIKVDFDALREANSDIVAWLYGADTGLDYPIVQGSDNEYYLHRLLDGSVNDNGTLFMDCECSADFSMPNTLIYGHNMRSGNMFGRLTDYKDPAYYKAHPYLYLMTPEQTYRVDLLAGCVVNDDADIYSFDLSADTVEAYMADSDFTAKAEYSDAYRLVTLSTCSYEYDNARFVVLGQLIPIDD
ncbi:MAG: class B sortase [Clostridiales bacterium]|nr:class B sortase [Candidatus Cacconaster stercorequi]